MIISFLFLPLAHRPLVLLVSLRRRQVVAIKAKDIPGYEAGGGIPNNVSRPDFKRVLVGQKKQVWGDFLLAALLYV